MGREIRLFKSQEKKSLEELSNFLHQVADKISSGQIILKQGTESLKLEIPNNIILEIQVEEEDKGSKGIQNSLEIEIKWFKEGKEAGELTLG